MLWIHDPVLLNVQDKRGRRALDMCAGLQGERWVVLRNEWEQAVQRLGKESSDTKTRREDDGTKGTEGLGASCAAKVEGDKR